MIRRFFHRSNASLTDRLLVNAPHCSSNESSRKPFTKIALLVAMTFSTNSIALDSQEIHDPITAHQSSIIEQVWRANIALFGDGNREHAITQMHRYTDIQHIINNNTQLHPQTHEFIEGLWNSFENFNLKKFHRLLPETDAQWRKLSVIGQIDDSQYLIGPPSKTLAASPDTAAAQQSIADLFAELRATKTNDGRITDTYLLQMDLRYGLGQFSWAGVQEFRKESLKLLSSAPLASNNTPEVDFQFAATHAKVSKTNPTLSQEDAYIIALLWTAYPNLWALYSSLAEVNDVLVEGWDTGQDIKKLKLEISLRPDLIKKNYPKIAKFLKRMNKLARAKITLNSDLGTMATMYFDTKTLNGYIELYVSDGIIVPVKAPVAVPVTVQGANPITKTLNNSVALTGQSNDSTALDTTPLNITEAYTLKADFYTNVLGVKAKIENLKSQLAYTQTPTGAEIRVGFNTMPDLNITGNVLGFMPVRIVNVFIPGSIQSIAEQFIEVVIGGHNGQGFTLDINFSDKTTSSAAVIAIKSSLASLNNRLVSFAVSVLNHAVIPNDKEAAEIRQLINDMTLAFNKDLDRYSASLAIISQTTK